MNANLHQGLIERFYAALQRRDAATMAVCYHRRAVFRDPVFELDGERVGQMWKMLCARGADLRVEFSDVFADANRGSAEWQAWYTFKSTGRPVHNVIHAHFRFVEGLIVEHIDTFNFWRWARQALGPAGLLLGWTPLVRAKVQREASKALERFDSERLGASGT